MNRARRRSRFRKGPPLPPGSLAIGSALAVPWLAAAGLAWDLAGARAAVATAALGIVATVWVGLAIRRREREAWSGPARTLARALSAFNEEPGEAWELPSPPNLVEVVGPLRELQAKYLALRSKPGRKPGDTPSPPTPPGTADSGELPALAEPGRPNARLTRSGSFEPPEGYGPDLMATGEFSTLDMINRLEPRGFRWIESSPIEQEFLGWSFDQLRERSFLDIVQADDRELARQQLKIALARGEGHGLVYRITTARGEAKAVELNVGVRYAPDGSILHLRCHLADVTAKLRDETELRRRTQELIQANDQLRRTNRELEELKNRYSDLYQNAPAMYFAVDRRGVITECNDTMVRTLGHPRSRLVGQPATCLLPPGRDPSPMESLTGIDRAGTFDHESEWVRADGQVLSVLVTTSAVAGSDGRVRQCRCVAQDITARRALEAEIRIKGERLALANEELSRKNRELDEFTYVVSHDLQEPLRTLIAFSDFLMRDQGDRLDDAGRDYVRYLVEASRRLRALIQDLLSLSRAGKVTGEFGPVNLGEVVEVVRADLAELIRSKDAEVVVDGSLPVAWGDRDRIGQLVANLVGNALKYNDKARPRVEVGCQPGPGPMVTLRVRDDGIGIEPQFHAKIFQLFRRLHTREEYEGNGAGLAICQKIAQAHGGRIWVESEPGLGSTFFVSLPRPPAEATSSRRAESSHAS